VLLRDNKAMGGIGSNHFPMKTVRRVSTEMSLHVLTYNLK
jgi:hypothetical protein